MQQEQQQQQQKKYGRGSSIHLRRSSKLCPLYKKRKVLEEAPEGTPEKTVTVKIGLNTGLAEELLHPVIQDAVYRCTDMYCEASRIFNGY